MTDNYNTEIHDKTLMVIVGYLLILTLVTSCVNREKEYRPNIIWLVSEDNSQHYMQLYNEGGASMPAIESLASNGIVFDRAFSNAPVCSVARSTLISGCYALRIGAQYHRRMQLAPMPDGLKMFPYYLRQTGYYTSNNSKEDYNLIKSNGVWDESSKQASYKNRKPGQPFFHVQNYGTTHEGSLHFPQSSLNEPLNAPLLDPFPYHPDTDIFRYTYERYIRQHQKVDTLLGAFIDELGEEGLLENTIVFYFGDHGGVLPRSKGYVYESGVHVPLVIYVPDKWKKLSPFASGTRTDAFVEFVDFAPTVLNLAAVKIPEEMDGIPFMGELITREMNETRNSAFSYADRFDEKYDMVRGLRIGKYKYIRNYQPFNIDALFNFYRYKMLAYQEWRDLYSRGQLSATQSQFFEARPPEALYNVELDPHETNNLINDPAYEWKKIEFRSAMNKKLKTMPDLGFFPEPHFLTHGIGNPVKYGQEQIGVISKLVDIADLSLTSFAKAGGRLEQLLRSEDYLERYWALIVCSTFGPEAAGFYDEAQQMMNNDPNNLVRMRAIEFLGLNGHAVDNEMINDILSESISETEANLMLNSVALLKMVVSENDISISSSIFNPAWLDNKNDLVRRRIEFINQEKL